MASLAYGITTGGTTLPKLYRKVQGEVLTGFQRRCEEFGLLRRAKNLKIDYSLREITFPIDISRQGGGAFIPEGGYEANPRTVAPQELTFVPVHYNDRFNITITSLAIDRLNKKAMLESQLKWQVKKMAEGMANRFGQQFYGFSTGVVCLTSTIATGTTGTYTLKDAYGQSDLDNATYISQFFAVGDRVALIRSAALVTNAIGTVTAITEATSSIDVTWNGSVTSADGDAVVFANSIENTTIAGTDYNQTALGLLEMVTATSVHGLSGATFPLWTAYQNSDAGRYTISHHRKLKFRVENRGGGEIDTWLVAQGVDVDIHANQFGAVRFLNPDNMALDGTVKVEGTYFTSRKVPNSRVFGFDSDSVRIWHLEDMPAEEGTAPAQGDAGFDKVQDRNAFNWSFDFHYNLFTGNRANLAMATGLTEQAV
jgi:hypothetical protein